MKKLVNVAKKNDAITRPAKQEVIDKLQEKMGFALSDDYIEYLRNFGVISHGPHETYGLGVSDGSHLHVLTAYNDLSSDPSYPKGAVPLLEVGDGHYYLYNNKTGKVLLWATPNGGVVKEVGSDLESFLVKHVFL